MAGILLDPVDGIKTAGMWRKVRILGKTMMTFSPWMHSISCILSKLGRNWSLYMLFAMDGLMKIKPLNFFFITFFERNFVLMGLLLLRQSVD